MDCKSIIPRFESGCRLHLFLLVFSLTFPLAIPEAFQLAMFQGSGIEQRRAR